jgi:hypothetical protein
MIRGYPLYELTLNMDESNRWGLPRYMTLLIVSALHMLLLAALVMASRTQNISASMSDPIELLFISPPILPKIRSENSRPPHLSGDTAVSIVLPALDSSALASSPIASGSDGNESGVNWAAEARRAIQAFDIRNHQAPSSRAISSSPGEDNWWPRAQHRAGDQFKTANGDWIVWINPRCYQVASAAAPAYAPGVALAQTVCLHESAAPHDDSSTSLPAHKKLAPKE